MALACLFPSAATTAMARTLDAGHFNRVANDVAVRPFLGGDGPLDLTAIIESPAHFAFATDHGGFLVCALGSGYYEVHSLFLPEGRGVECLPAMHEAMAYMFSRTDCLELRTKVTATNKPGHALARLARFESRFWMPIAWNARETSRAEFFGLSIERWALTAREPVAAGRWFHDQIAEAKRAAGSRMPVHADDAVHDAMAGACVLLLRGGQVTKGVRLYNAWAAMAGFQAVTLVAERPAVIDLVDALVEVTPDGMAVLRCR